MGKEAEMWSILINPGEGLVFCNGEVVLRSEERPQIKHGDG